LLFGSFLGITSAQVVVLLVVTVVVLGVLAWCGRPLLFASVDPLVATARGLPVRWLSTAFLVLLGATVAEVSQITGSLLVFALLVMPAATAQALSVRPRTSLVLSVVVALAITWLGLSAAFYSVYPIGFYVTSIGFVVYVVALFGSRARVRLA
jgi:zinc/manganese transport system permease protein